MTAQMLDQIERVEEIYTRFDVEQAWRDQIKAVDRWEWNVCRHGESHYQAQLALAEMDEATAEAVYIERTYHDQYRRRIYHDDGTWEVAPKRTAVLIDGVLRNVEIIRIADGVVEAMLTDGLHSLPVESLKAGA